MSRRQVYSVAGAIAGFGAGFAALTFSANPQLGFAIIGGELSALLVVLVVSIVLR